MLADVDNRMRVAQEEIFGPVACLLPFKDEAEGLRGQRRGVRPGVVHLDPDVSKVLRLARNIEAGMVFVNTQNVRDLRQPFGGVKASGTGREGGEYSFEVFAEMKNVCISMGDHPIPKWGSKMGKLALAAKSRTYRQCISLSCRVKPRLPSGAIDGHKEIGSAAASWASTPSSSSTPTGW